jgi:hypothetical protein
VDEAAAKLVSATPVAAPGPARAAYQEHYLAFRELYPALAPWFKREAARG